MKKLLTILTGISIISNTAFNVISCTSSNDENKDEDDFELDEHTSMLVNEVEENAVFKLLEDGIDADFLTTNNTGLDAESLIQDEALKNDLSIIDLTITDDVEKPLSEGDNDFNIDLIIGNKTSKLKTKIKNVKSAKLSDAEVEDKTEEFIKQEAEIPLHSSTNNKAVADAIEERLHEIGEEDAEVEITKQTETIESEISYAKNTNPYTNTQKTSPWILKVTNLKHSKNKAIQKPLNFKKIDTTKVDNASETEKENIAFNEISKLLNDNSFDSYKILSTANTFKQAGDIANGIANIYTENLKDLKISYKPSNENSLLQVNNNKIQLTFQYKNNPVRTIDIVLNNITNAQDDRELSLRFIKKEFEKGIDASHLHGWNTIFDALNYFQSEATKINKNAYVSLSKKFINKKMKTLQNDISKMMKKVDKSIASIPVDLVIDMALYSPHLVHKFLKDNQKDALNPILSSIKNHSDFYLNGGKEQAIELEIGFENPFNSKKANKKTSISENKKAKTTKITGKIMNVKPRTAANAKTIIENEKLTINQKITFNEAILVFKKHINDTLFFSKTGNSSFSFNIELKNKKQEKENLKPNLNKIKCLIKPDKSSSFFKGNLEITFYITYILKPTKNKKPTSTKNDKKKQSIKNKK